MTRILLGHPVRPAEIAAHIARGNAKMTSGGDKNMRVILANATLERKSLARRGRHAGRIEIESHIVVETRTQRVGDR